MSTKDLKGLANLLARLDAAAPIVARRDMYYRGRQPLRFMVDEVDEQLAGFNVNLCRVAVQALAVRPPTPTVRWRSAERRPKWPEP